MPDPVDSIDITTDLNNQGADSVPYHGSDVPMNQPAQVVEKPDKAAPPEGEKPAPSLRDLLSDAFKGSEAPKQPETPQAAPAAPPAPTDAPDLVKVGDRFHRRDGGFASREEIDAFNAAQAAPGTPPPVQMPPWAEYLTDVEKTQLTNLPAEIRQFVERTMDGVMQRGAQYDEYGMIEQVIGPRRNAWAQEGMNPIVALNQLFALSDFAGRDPSQFVLWFSDQHRLDLDELLDTRDANRTNGQSDPQYVGLQQEIAQLRNTISGFANSTVQQQQAHNFSVVQQFMDEKDEAGKPLYPYFNDVASEIASNVAVLRQQQPYLQEREILKAAYDFATYSNPAIRQRVQYEQSQAAQERAAAEAARARQVGISINGGPAGDTSQQPNNANRTLRDELLHAYRQSAQE